MKNTILNQIPIEEILESFNACIFVFNISGEIEFYNHYALELLLKKRKKISDLFSGRESKLILKKLKANESLIRFETKIKIDRTDQIPIGISFYPLTSKNSKKSIGGIGLFRDLRPVYKAQAEEQQKDKLASLGKMSAGLAHELKNMLNTIKGFSQLILEEAKELKHKELIEHTTIVVDEVNLLNKTVNSFLDFARQDKLDLRKTDIIKFLKKIIKDNNSFFKKEEVKVKFIIKTQNLEKTRIDKIKIERVFYNLIKNAVEAMRKVKNKVLIIETGKIENYIYIHFKDRGSGIKKENIENLFTPFFTTKSSGTGMGLAISYNIINAHNGKIEVESKLNKGTNFSVFLPIK